MKTEFAWIATTAVISLTAMTDVRAEGGFGAGVILGEPTGISLKNG